MTSTPTPAQITRLRSAQSTTRPSPACWPAWWTRAPHCGRARHCMACGSAMSPARTTS
ncbi:hypothetical protein HaLaN_06109, partial [Haematococcus lacustris]